MANKPGYPLIMKPAQLKALSDYVISKLGMPIFFSAPEPSRPQTADIIGGLYEVVTGLYLIYHDYGMRMLKTYLLFCKAHQIDYDGFVFPHYYSIMNLRSGFCHGCLPNGKGVTILIRELDYYLKGENKKWPEFVHSMTEEQCGMVLEKIAGDSDRLVQYIKRCADQIAQNEELLNQWRGTLTQNALNANNAQYGRRSESFFDERIVTDLENSIRAQAPQKPHQETVKDWLSAIEPKLLSGRFTDSDELRVTLTKALEELYHPIASLSKKSSADILLEGIDL